MLLTDRLTNDIKRGIVHLDFEKIKADIIKLFNELYDQNKMEYEESIDAYRGINRFEYCKEIYSIVAAKNGEYYNNNKKTELSKFWIKLKDNPDSLYDLMDSYNCFEVFAMYNTPEEIIDVIGSLSNEQLFEFSRWMGSRRVPIVENEYERAQAMAEALQKKYKDLEGVKAGHMKQIVRVIKNKRTDYDPEYIDLAKAAEAENQAAEHQR